VDISLFFETFILNWEIVALFFLIAILYASVGFGGGSSYLAVLALTSLALHILEQLLYCVILLLFQVELIFT
jgi:hypothetical protein